MESQMLFHYGRPEFLESLEYLLPVSGKPGSVDVLDIVHYADDRSECQPAEIVEEKLDQWLKMEPNIQSTSDRNPEKRMSRFILGHSLASAHFGYKSQKFPGLDSYPTNSLPFPVDSYIQVEKIFQLPSATPWALVSDWTHFQKYNMDMKKPDERGLGFTMRLSSRGIIDIDVCVSISYRPSTGTVNAFLQGCTSQQQAEIGRRLQEFRALARHPLLLPIILVELKMRCIEKEEFNLWELLIGVEGRTDQTGAPAINRTSAHDRLMVDGQITNSKMQQERLDSEFNFATLDIIGVIQRTAGAGSHVKALLLSIEEIRRSIRVVEDAAVSYKTVFIKSAGEILSEKLDLLEHKTRVIMGDIEYIEKRAQVQQLAVYNYMAKRDAKAQRNLAEISSQIARASKRDSSAMKSIAVLTMVFLPGTYIATFFTMPILDFTTESILPSARRTFWLYWTITIPLTAAVLIAYLVFIFYIDRKHKKEDRKV